MIYFQYLVDAVGIGVLYALVALGLGLVFGVMRLVNFAHGELLMAGGYTLFLTTSWATPVRLVTVMIVVTILALIIERIALRPLRSASPTTTLIMTFAVSFLLRSIAQRKWSTQGKAMGLFEWMAKPAFEAGEVTVSIVTLMAIGVGTTLLTLVTLVLTKTSVGLQMRAAAMDPITAQTLGIRTALVVRAAMVIAALLACAALFLFAPQRPVVTPDYGLLITLIALVGVVVGGMNRLAASTAGGFAVGFATSMVFSLLPRGQRVFLDSAVFGLVIVVLLVRPGGLFEQNRRTARL